MPTFEDLARIVARSTTPRLCGSSMTLVETLMNPGFVSMTLLALNFPDCRAAATTNGLIDEPGSRMSVTARLR